MIVGSPTQGRSLVDLEAALREREDAYRMLFEGMLDGFAHHEMIYDDTGRAIDYRFLSVNPAFEAQTGLRAVDINGRTAREVIPGLEDHWIYTYGEVARTGVPVRFENVAAQLGRYYEVLAFRPKPGQFACIFQDITARRRAEADREALLQRMQHQQKLESLGVLAGGIAHDFNNLLCAINTGAEMSATALSPQNPALHGLQIVREATARASELCHQLLAYAGRGKFVVEPTDLSEMVREMKALLDVSVGKKITLEVQLAEDLPAISADRAQIGQILVNLVVNASDAIGDRPGRVRVETSAVTLTTADLRSMDVNDVQPGLMACLSVSDNGCGMDPATLARIFDPFFTTKLTGRGLGLAATSGIIKGHKGAIHVDSLPNQGARFRVFFPAIAGKAVTRSEPAIAQTPFQGHGLALLVDDEPLLRRVGSRILGQLGFEVMVAADGAEALSHLRAPDSKVRVALLDMTMPELSGAETFAELRRLHPGLPVLLMSGYETDDAVSRCTREPAVSFLRKPFGPVDIAEALRGLLGG